MVTLEQLAEYPKWAANIVRELGDRELAREVIWL
jgi:hypothetical protein